MCSHSLHLCQVHPANCCGPQSDVLKHSVFGHGLKRRDVGVEDNKMRDKNDIGVVRGVKAMIAMRGDGYDDHCREDFVAVVVSVTCETHSIGVHVIRDNCAACEMR